MRTLWLLCVFAAFSATAVRFQTITVQAQIILRCKNPKNPIANVFLMESDFADNALDEDDTFDFGTYYFGKTPEYKLQLSGDEFEFSGLDPYIYINHGCTNETNSYEPYSLRLMNSMYRSRFFDIIIDLDTKVPVVVTRYLN